jgi:tetratricopeptide (TPR) repeat protein
VLELAAEYMRLGLYRQAMYVLSADYPTVPADQMEPGAVPPKDSPLVAYYRGYCHEKLGESGEPDYAIGQKLSTLYVFPGRPETLEVLHAALHTNKGDATAHYLLGTLLFSRGLTDDALAEWKTARGLNASIPVLDADIGRALLGVKHDAAAALEAFRAGLTADGTNAALYEGIDQASSLLGRPASERVADLERYPDQANMPGAHVYAVALDQAEAGAFDKANALFENRYVPRAEGGLSTPEVQAEVNLLKVLNQARPGHCPTMQSVGDARSEYLVGVALARCGKPADAAKLWKSAAAARGASQLPWARAAAKKLPGYNDAQWRKRLEEAVARAESPYIAGMLEAALGQTQAAHAKFEQALWSPGGGFTHHLSRLALRGGAQPE